MRVFKGAFFQGRVNFLDRSAEGKILVGPILKQGEGMASRAASGRRKKIYEQIVDRLNELIRGGELKAGDRLPPERKLAELFQVSRNTVREAIKTLEEKGVVESRTGAGTYVAEKGGDEIVSAMAGALEAGRNRLGEVLELRRLLEPRIAALAAERITGEGIRRLEEILLLQEAALGEGKRQAELDDRFHLAVAEASGNSVLAGVFGNVREILGESRSEGLQSRARGERSVAAHREILSAVRRGQKGEAEEKMRDHLLNVEKSLNFPSGTPEETGVK